MTEGRLEIGLARGSFEYTFRRFKMTMDQSHERFLESVEVLERLFAGEEWGWVRWHTVKCMNEGSNRMYADALIFKCDGWSAELERSGLSVIHTTVGSPFASFEETCDQITAAWTILDNDPEHLLPVARADDFDRVREHGGLGVIFGLQNASQVGEKPERVELLWRLGIRVLQLTYNDPNLLGDGCIEPRNAGLTRLGREVVQQCNRSGVVVDVSHVGPQTSMDAVVASTQPVVATHSNRRALAVNPRNKPDEILQAIAQSGGIVGISPWGPMCWKGEAGVRPTVETFVEQIVGMVEFLGEDAVAIGTDLPAIAGSTGNIGLSKSELARRGAAVQAKLDQSLSRFPAIFADYTSNFENKLETRYCAGFDSLARWSELHERLERAGMSDTAIEKTLGLNWIRVCREVWSARSRSHD